MHPTTGALSSTDVVVGRYHAAYKLGHHLDLFVYDTIINGSLLQASMEGISSTMIWLAMIGAV
jgi:hypothetical protein